MVGVVNLSELAAICDNLEGNKLQSRYILCLLKSLSKNCCLDSVFLQRVHKFISQFTKREYFINNWSLIDDGVEFDALFSVLDNIRNLKTMHKSLREKNRSHDWNEVKDLIVENLEEHESIKPGEVRSLNDEMQRLISAESCSTSDLRKFNKDFLFNLEYVNSGRNGKVYRGKLRGIDVAIKESFDGNLGDLSREATILQSRNLPGVIRFFGVDNPENPVMLAMELGVCSLFDWLYKLPNSAGLGKFTFKRKLSALSECASTIAFLHSVHVLHRDIKPSNVIVMLNGSIKLSDFGHAKHMFDADCISAANGRTNAYVSSGKGTDFYMAPELIMQHDGFEYSSSTDMYAFGVFMNEILSGKLPYQENFPLLANMHNSVGECRPKLFSIPKGDWCFVTRLNAIVTGCWKTVAKNRLEADVVAFNLESMFKVQYGGLTVNLSDPVIRVNNRVIASGCTSMGVYSGETVSNLRHGKGEYESLRGFRYSGDWKNDMMDGFGICRLVTGGEYEGEWKKGCQHGHGILRLSTEVYEGGWANSHKFGRGVCTYSDGSSYEGEWDIHKHGEGVYKYSDGSVYSGSWVNGLREGHGEWTGPDNRSYIGEWKNDKKDGKGVYKFENGDLYDGDWFQSQRHGLGVYKFADGTVYFGEWKNDSKHGHGQQKRDTEIFEGDWVDGTLIPSSMVILSMRVWHFNYKPC